MYVQDLSEICQPQSKQNKRLNLRGLAVIFLLSFVSFLFATHAFASDKNLFSSTATLSLGDNKPISTLQLHNYLEINNTSNTLSYHDATAAPSLFWQPLAQNSKAIAGNTKAHWFRLHINNPSDQAINYVFSIAPTRSLYVKTQVLPFSNESTPSNHLVNAPLKTTEIFSRNTDQAKRIDIHLPLAAHEKKILIINMASDIWTIPHFSLQTKKQLTLGDRKDNQHWQLINGIFICMIFFILSAAIITKQSGLLWLPLYSISTICFIPNYLIYNFKKIGINAAQINTLNIELSVISLIAFIGILKYIFYDNRILQKIPHTKFILTLIFLISVTAFFSPKDISPFIYISQSIEVLASIFLSFIALRQKHPIAACLIGPAKIIVFSLILIVISYAKLSVISQLIFHISLATIILLDTAILAIILLIIDRHRREKKLYNLISAAKKEQQVAAISPMLGKDRHDLRASLSDIIGLSDLIINTPLDQEQRKNILDIQKTGRQGLEKIDQLFSYKDTKPSRLISQEPFILSTLLSECAQYYSYRADELNKEFIIDIAESTPEYWKGDHEQIRQLFMHILDYYLSTNSLYEARINVSYFNDSSFRIEFAMPALNSTLDTDKEINVKLSTAKLITKKLGGNLSFKNKNNTILITVNIQAVPTENHSRSQLDLELLKNRRIIIVDDSDTSCNVIESYLKRWHVSTFKANNFSDALAIIKHQKNIEQPIDLALIDYVMPNINGIEVSNRLRYDPDIPDNLSIIIMSNAASSINPTDTKKNDIKQVLDKPVLAHTLKLVLLEEFFLLKSLKAEASTRLSLNDTSKKLLLIEDNPVSTKIVCSMLKKLNVNYQHVDNGRDAIKAVTSTIFDIILMDCELPDESGFTITQKIRAYEKANKAQHTPATIVALTAYDDENNKAESIKAGMNDFLCKPISLVQLAELIDKSS